MFFNAPGSPDPLKRAVYLFAATILGLLLSFIAHVLIEVNYLSFAFDRGRTVPFYGNCALSPALQIALSTLGLAGGFLLGRFWWRKIYIERAWAKKHSFQK